MTHPAVKEAREWVANATLEELVTSPHFFGLTTASPVQRAFCRVADGRPLGDLEGHPDVVKLLGGGKPVEHAPLEVSWLGAVRCAKSLMAAAGCVRMSQRCEIPSWLKAGDIPRVPILSVDMDKADAVMNHLSHTIDNSPVLQTILLSPRKVDKGGASLTLRHPTGRPIVAKVVAGKAAGNAVVAYWLAGCIFDEFGKMHGETDAVVNWDETRAVAMDRILGGGQTWNVGSPWAPEGPAHKQYVTHYGKPSRELVVMNSDGPSSNPAWWTPERVEVARRRNPNFRTDVLALFATADEAFFPVEQLQVARLKRLNLERSVRAEYAAYIDPATRGNAFTLIVVTRVGRKLVVACAYEWVGSKSAPLDTGAVLDDMKPILGKYGLTHAATDQYMGDALASQARERGLALHQWEQDAKEKLECALTFRTKLGASEVELCQVQSWRGGETEIVDHLVLDTQRVRKKVTQSGAIVFLPLTTDGRHCDFWPPLSMAMRSYLGDLTPESDATDVQGKQMEAELVRRHRQGDTWDE